jgi:RNA polymerase sigma-70 factor (ECF subfamily)
LERFRRQHWLFPVEEVEEDAALDWNGPEQVLGLNELLKMVSELPPRYRMVFNLYAIEGYPHHEVAGMLGISEGTSKSNLARARAILQRRLGYDHRPTGENLNDYGRHG